MAELNGQCMCGAVTINASPARDAIGACHCDMCRRWTSSMLITFEAEPDFVVSGPVRTYRSSEWAERSFCENCGSALWYRMTAPGPMHGKTQISAGLFEDSTGADLRLELYIDRKPSGYAFEGNRRQMTEDEVIAAFAPNNDGQD